MNKKTRFSQGKTKQKRLIRAMKIFLLFAFLTVGSCFASETYSQEASLSINVENKKIDTILDQLFSGTENNYSISDRQI